MRELSSFRAGTVEGVVGPGIEMGQEHGSNTGFRKA